MRSLYTWLLSATMCLFLFGCQTLDEEAAMAEGSGVLKVKARSSQDEDAAYPMRLYAFSEDGQCVSSRLIESPEERMELVLSPGNYRIVLMGGGKDGYVFPAALSLDDAVVLKGQAGADAPLLHGMADVTVGSSTEARLEVALSYAVAALKVELDDVPADVSAVTVSLSPFYDSMAMSGGYDGGGYSLSMPCTLDTGGVWSTGMRYVFPGSASETVFSVRMKMKDGTETTHGYTWRNVLEAGRPYDITGSYLSGVVLEGDYVVKGWKEPEKITFRFGAGSQDDAGGDGGLDSPSGGLENVPEVGSIWNGAIVAQVIGQDESGVDVLLLSLEEWDIVASQVEEVAAGYCVNGLSGWRLPTFEEAQMLRGCFSGDNRIELNGRINDYDSMLVGIDGGERYLCDKWGVYYSFIFSGGTSITKAGVKRTYYVRLVRKCRLSF